VADWGQLAARARLTPRRGSVLSLPTWSTSSKPASRHCLSELAEGGYIERAEPVVFIGDSGTGKTHLLSALCIAACRQRRRVRFTTAAALVNELVEAKQQLQLRRVLARWARYDVIAIDEVGYVPLAELGAEFLFQVISDRAEQAAVLLTTNLPFSEWTQVIPNARLCKALLDRITDRAHIIETGSDSYRFRRTLELRGRHVRSKRTIGAIPNPQLSTEKSSSPGTPVQKRDDDDDDGGSAAAPTPPANKEDSLTVPA
jgi:hypothetical protein